MKHYENHFINTLSPRILKKFPSSAVARNLYFTPPQFDQNIKGILRTKLNGRRYAEILKGMLQNTCIHNK